MEKEQEEHVWDMGPEMPHETLMDKKGLEFDELSPTIQEDIRQFDKEHSKALEDGIVSEDEHRILLEKSYEIAKKILVDHADAPGENSSNGLLIGLVLGIGAAFGIGKLMSS